MVQSRMGSFKATSTKRAQRMAQILTVLSEHDDEVALSWLASRLSASSATIRRDVAALADQGLLSRTHGGVLRVGKGGELPIGLRDPRFRAAKEAIARLTASLLPTGRHAVALCGGTTTTEVLRALTHRSDLTIVTNSLSIALEAAQQGQSRVLITGGVLRPNSLELVGSLAESTFRQVNVGTAILGCDGFDADGGATTHDETEARTNHTMMERAQRVIMVCDSSKIGQVTLAKVADTRAFNDLVTDTHADEAELARIKALGVRVHLAQLGH